MGWSKQGTVANEYVSWTPVLRTINNDQSGWWPHAPGCVYRRIGNLIVGRAHITGDPVFYGTEEWFLTLPATPNLTTAQPANIGDVYFWNGGRTTYGVLLWTSLSPTYGAQLFTADATTNSMRSFYNEIFWGGAGGRQLLFNFFYEAI